MDGVEQQSLIGDCGPLVVDDIQKVGDWWTIGPVHEIRAWVGSPSLAGD